MNTSVFSFHFRRGAVAAAACAVCLASLAQGANAQTTISFGAGAVSGDRADRALFGQYNGLGGDRSAVGLLGIDYSLRNQEASQWVDFSGSNLLGDTRELGLIWKDPGNWKLNANYGELVHYGPNIANTGMLGAGSSTPQLVSLPGGPGSGSDFEAQTKRTSVGLGLTKIFSPAWQFALDLKTEKKEGSRLFGTGMNCPSVIAPTCGANTGWALLMLPEPVDARTSQVEARVNYAMDQLRFSLGYYGSYYRNGNSTLNPSVPAGLNTNAGLIGILNQPLALAPDNQAHQFDLTGSFDLTPSTRTTFKFARAISTQNVDFAAAGLTGAPVGITNLGGDVATNSAKLSLTSRPTQQLSLLADWRYQSRQDNTPIAYYNSEGTAGYTNQSFPNRKTNGKLQANWQFNADYRGTLGADYEAIDRGVFTATSAIAGVSALRQQTQENSVHIDVRRRMSDNASGTVSLSSSRRDGSNWLKDNSGAGVTEVTDVNNPVLGLPSTAIFMPTLADRRRDKVKLFADWQPSEELTLQINAEGGRDQYSAPSAYGLRDSSMNLLSVDAAYALSDAWSINGYLSRGKQGLNQALPAGYLMAFTNTSVNASIGFTGKASAKFDVGGNLLRVTDRSVYAQGLDASADAYSAALLASTGGLPDIVYNQTALKLFGKYALDKSSSVRVDLIHQRNSVDDWTWGYNGVPFVYSDGSTVLQKPSQSVSFIGVTYVYQLP